MEKQIKLFLEFLENDKNYHQTHYNLTKEILHNIKNT